MDTQCAIKTEAPALRLARYIDGVADGARTHDNRNHNPCIKTSNHAGLQTIVWNKKHNLTTVFKGSQRLRSR